MKNLLLMFLCVVFLSQNLIAQDQVEVNEIKKEIIELANQFKGQADPDYVMQDELDVLVDQLLELSPQPPVADRLELLYGTWTQVWGPYNYKNADRVIDPNLSTDEIYQVIFPEGYYYNVSPNYPDGDTTKERIGLLRGEFKLSNVNSNALNIKFTKYPGVSTRPQGIYLWDLAEMAESGSLQNQITIVPTFVVWAFFGSGSLNEVYTDEDLRITYGTSNRSPIPSLYIMTKVD